MNPAMYTRWLLEQSDYHDILKYEAMVVEEYLFITWYFDDYYCSHYLSEVHKLTPDGWVKLQPDTYSTGQV